MNAALATVFDVARQLAAAAPAAWRGDRLFRWAAMGTGLTLGVLLLGATGGRHPAPPVSGPQEAVQAAPGPAPALPSPIALEPPQRLPVGAGGPSPAAAPAVPVIAPGQPLDAAPATRPGADRFGTVSPRPHDPATRP